jgi:cytochrome c5
MKPFHKICLALFLAGISSCSYHYQEEEKIAPEPPACDTTTAYVFANVQPVFDAKCKSCHDGGSPDLSDYTTYKNYISSDRSKFESAIRFTGLHPMPQGGPKLPDSDICTILNWIKQGAKQ